MKKLLLIVTLIAVAFSFICCDADSIVKTGQKLQKMRDVNKADSASAADDYLGFTVFVVDAMIKDDSFDPVKGNMPQDDLKVIVGLINEAKETSASPDQLSSIINQKAVDVSQDKKTNLEIKETIGNFISNAHDPTFQKAMKSMMKKMVSHEDEVDKLFAENLDKVETYARCIEPAVDALQAINDISYAHDGMTYGDVIAKAILHNMTEDFVLLVTGTGTEHLKTEIINSSLNNLSALEVIYGVTFDAPRIAGNIIDTL
jgi:hypothetical protein